MKSFGDRIADALMDFGILSLDQLEGILEHQKAKGGQLLKILLQGEYVTEEDMAISIGSVLDVPPIDLRSVKITREVGNLIPREIARQYKLIPTAQVKDLLYLAMADPLNMAALDEVRQIVKMEVVPLICTERGVVDALAKLDAEVQKNQSIEDIVPSEELEVNLAGVDSGDDIQVTEISADSDLVVRVAGVILTTLVRDKASDVHLTCCEKSLMLRYRIDGTLYDYPPPPKTIQASLIARMKIMANLDITEKRLAQDGRIRIRLAGRDVDFRMSFLPSKYGENVVGRVLDKTALAGNLDDTGMDEVSLKIFKEALDSPQGMILVTGPTGSGKTRTLYNALAELNKTQYNIITVEDPIEYELPRIVQVQVKPDIGFTFANVLRFVLRQDPDIVMVGEMRDRETAHIAVEAALTGHQVLSTLHTNDAAGAIARLTDMHVEPFLTASSLSLICAQRLLRKVCPFCKDVQKIPPLLWERLHLNPKDEGDQRYYKGIGCEHCKKTGYLGRVAVVEMLPVTDAIRQHITECATAMDIKREALRMGMKTLRMNAMLKAREGVTSLEEVLTGTFGDEMINP